MAQTKKKVIQKTKQQSAPESYYDLERSKEVDLEDEALVKLWGQAVDQLQSQVFNSESEAIEAVIDTVMTKLGIEDKDNSTRNYLSDMLTLDPEIKEELCATLNIKS